MGTSRADEIYKSKDANGITVYSDRAPVGPSERVSIPTRARNDDASRARVEEEQTKWAQADAERLARQQREAETRRAADEEKAAKCEAARNQHARFARDGRQYRLGENGERVYYSAEEIDEERAASRKGMREYCPPAPKPR